MEETVGLLLDRLDGSGSDDEWDAVRQLRRLENLPELLLNKYQTSKQWAVRASCVYHSLRYAKDSDCAYKLGVMALKDKSKVVRYRAAMLLAVAQKLEAIAPLQELADQGNGDAQAAINAIKAKDQNLFVDRNASGTITLNIQ